MNYADAAHEIATYRRQISELRDKMRETQKQIVPEPVSDYPFGTPDGEVTLAQLFGDKDTLFVIHNMGAGCPYCTLWADGFNGLVDHLENRAAFVVSSPDTPQAQQEFARSRGWRFRMVSHAGTEFAADMGYTSGEGFEPGVSVFRKDGDKILRVGDTHFGPGDDFCAVWHFIDLIPEGSDGWQPRYTYG